MPLENPTALNGERHLPPSYADLLRDHSEVIQGQAYTQEHGNAPDWTEKRKQGGYRG